MTERKFVSFKVLLLDEMIKHQCSSSSKEIVSFRVLYWKVKWQDNSLQIVCLETEISVIGDVHRLPCSREIGS